MPVSKLRCALSAEEDETHFLKQIKVHVDEMFHLNSTEKYLLLYLYHAISKIQISL